MIWPHTVERLEDDTYKVVLYGEHDFEELDRLTNPQHLRVR